MYLTLIPEKTIKTSNKISNRIQNDFPDSGLSRVAKEVNFVARTSKNRCEWISKPNILLRTAIGILIVGIFASLYAIWHKFEIGFRGMGFGEFVQFSEALLNILIIFGAAIIFLITVETRLKRRRALKGLYELRSLAHVIDMHQLSKDPNIVLNKELANRENQNHMTNPQLIRYLDYCCDLLALSSKIAALYAQNLNDSVVLDAVNDIESLAMRLSTNIWQKIKICSR